VVEILEAVATSTAAGGSAVPVTSSFDPPALMEWALG
jgi:hypothetical protein